MEFPQVGQHCAELNCNRLSFLPVTCKCGMIFCTEHFSRHSAECAAVHAENECSLEATPAKYVCSHPSCSEKSYVPLLCEKCCKHFCVTHRHITECFEKSADVIAAEIERFQKPINEFNAAKFQIDKKIDESISQAKKNVKTSQMAIKLQLMRVKNKATGLKTIPVPDRVYFNIEFYIDEEIRVLPIFISKTWSLGRAIDAIAEEGKIANRNKQINAPKLRLFDKFGVILSKDLSKTITDLLLNAVVVDGDDLILKYADTDADNVL